MGDVIELTPRIPFKSLTTGKRFNSPVSLSIKLEQDADCWLYGCQVGKIFIATVLSIIHGKHAWSSAARWKYVNATVIKAVTIRRMIKTINKVTKFSRILGLELAIQHILPCVKELSSYLSQHV
ncbi:hypothetical protein Tco_0250351, partial [Tanacetum coccineum]